MYLSLLCFLCFVTSLSWSGKTRESKRRKERKGESFAVVFVILYELAELGIYAHTQRNSLIYKRQTAVIKYTTKTYTANERMNTKKLATTK